MIVTVVPDNFSPSVKLSRDQFDLRLIRLNSVGSHGKKKKFKWTVQRQKFRHIDALRTIESVKYKLN